MMGFSNFQKIFNASGDLIWFETFNCYQHQYHSKYLTIYKIRPSVTEKCLDSGPLDNNQGYLKHLFFKQQAVQAITSDPNVQKWGF